MDQQAAHYDLVVVGASFAGLVAARTAAMRGLRVAVLEAKPNAGARVATTGILVKEAAEEIDIPHQFTRQVHGVRLYAPSLSSIDLFAPGVYFLTTDTSALLRWMAREAQRSGAAILYRARFQGAEWDGDRFRLGGFNLTTRFLMGADGARSAVARYFGLGRNQRFLAGIEHEYQGLDYDERFLHCFLDRRYAKGYLAWVAPGTGVAQVGLAASSGSRIDFEGFKERTAHLFGYANGAIVERRAGRIPVGGMVRPFARPGVLLCGDAAGMVSPLTGGGIRLAFHFGRRSALAIADHLQHLGPPPEVVLQRELPAFRVKGILRRAFDAVPSNPLFDAMLATAPMRALAQHVYFHRRNAGQQLSFAEFQARLEAAARGSDQIEGLRAQSLTSSPGAKA